LIWKGQFERIALKKLERSQTVFLRAEAAACHIEHGGAEVDSDGFRSRLGEGKGDVPSATTHIQGPDTGTRSGQSDQPTLPKAVPAKTLEIVDQVVTWSHGREQVAHPCRPRFRTFPRYMVFAAHPGSVPLNRGNS
jgi:hypothetical protein